MAFPIKVALGQMEVIPGRPDLNTKVMLEMIHQSRLTGADMVIFPEMAIPGYLLGDTWEQPSFLRDCEEFGRQIIAASEGMIVVFGNVAVDWNKNGEDGRVRKYNACFVVQNGKLCGGDNFPYPFRIKALQPNYREFEDTRHFFSLRKLAQELRKKPEELSQPVSVTISGKPLKLGCILCEDGWDNDYSFKPMDALHQNGPAHLYINISSSPFTLGKNNKRNRIFSKQAQKFGVPLVYVNNAGVQNNGKTVFTFDGSSTLYDKKGQTIGLCPSFTPHLMTRILNLESGGEALEVPDDTDIGTIHQAVEYGIKGFMRSIGMERVVIGLSGGIDSAVSAALYTRVLGPDNVLLVNMPSIHNSPTTRNLASQLAKNLGCLYTIVPIQDSVDYTVNQIERTTIVNLQHGQETSLSVTPLMVENIQARDRSARILAALSAAFGAGFTCNANKSEMTVGYSTLYGDHAGFFAALADLWKFQIYELAHYLNDQVYQREIIPGGIIDLVPSAELSPQQNVDRGMGDPLYYPYHDYLFRSFVEHWNRAVPEDILKWYSEGILEKKIGCEIGLVNRLFTSAKDFIEDLERWWTAYTGMGVAKRIQAPPVLAFSRRVFGFDHREAQNGPYFTSGYLDLRKKMLVTG